MTLLRYALSWGGVVMGLCMRPETVDSVVPLVFPVTMISNPVMATVGWSLLLLAVFVPLATWRYQNANR